VLTSGGTSVDFRLTSLPFITPDATPEGWAPRVEALGWEAVTFDDGKVWYWQIDGACPRCEHLLHVETGPGFASDLTVEEARERSVKPTDVWAMCSICVDDHPGRPDDQRGCGAAAYIKGPTPTDAQRLLQGGL
jgi:hypothetical protein